MSNVQHTWRLYAPDEDFEVSITLTNLIARTEPTDIDHWFEGGESVFSGRGTPPKDPHIEERLCEACVFQIDTGGVAWRKAGCDACCDTGFTYHWIQTPAKLIQESIDGLHQIIYELNNPLGKP